MQDWQEEILARWRKKETRRDYVTDRVRDRLAREFKGKVLYNEPMNRHTSMKVGGPCDVFLSPSSIDDIVTAGRIAREEDIPLLFHGSGSNTLVQDKGIRGFVLNPGPAFKELRVTHEGESDVDVLAQAGVSINALVYFCQEKGLEGLESFIGIPGSIGGAIVMNAGARGVEIKDHIREIYLLTPEGEQKTVSREKIDFVYRSARLPRSHVVTGGLFRLIRSDPESVTERVREFQKLRVQSQPIEFPNLGSIFKNPEPQKKGKATTTAGRLIEETGLKNVRVGGARISEKHANFIVNERGATAKDVLVLINLVKEKVKEKTGILLETEIRIVGEEAVTES